MRDIFSNTLVKATLPGTGPAAVAATTNGTSVDRRDGTTNSNYYQDALIIVNSGTATGTGSLTVTFEDSDNNSTWAATTALEGDALPVLTTANDEAVYETRYTGLKRYVRAVVTLGGTVSILLSIEVVLSNPRRKPAVH